MKSSFKALGLAVMVASAKAYFLTGPAIITSGRIDPIVNPGATSSHSHSIFGGSNFRPTVNTTQLQESQCTSMPVQEDLSAYWFMDYYFAWKNGSFTQLPPGPVVYYLFDSGDATAFPPGFRMISGDTLLRTFDPNSFAQKAVSFLCLDFDGFSPTTNYFPRGPCKNGVRAMINFPACWDGKNLDSPDHQSHVAFLSEGPDSGDCTDPKFPIRLPRIFIENYLPTNDFEQFRDQALNTTQPFVSSNGDSSGYSHHADFINGWQEGKLQPILDNCGAVCNSAFGDPACCEKLGFLTLAKSGTNCRITDLLDEQSTGTIPKLPGNNPLQPEGKRATAVPQPSPPPPFMSPVFVYTGNTPTATGTPVPGTVAPGATAAATTSAAGPVTTSRAASSASDTAAKSAPAGGSESPTAATTPAASPVTTGHATSSASGTAAKSAPAGGSESQTPGTILAATPVTVGGAASSASGTAAKGAPAGGSGSPATSTTAGKTTVVPTNTAAPAGTSVAVAAGQSGLGNPAAGEPSAVNQNTSGSSPTPVSVSPARTCKPKPTGAYAKRAARRGVHHHKPMHHNTF